MELYEHQKQALEFTADQDHVAYYHDMGLGKTYTGSEKMIKLGAKQNLVICQKSKVDDWRDHFAKYYKDDISAYDLTDKKQWDDFWENPCGFRYRVGIINYDLAWRRKDLLKLKDFTLLLDESSLIQNENSKRAKFILKMQPKNVILLSGTPTGGKYETLWSQMSLLGWKIDKKMFFNHYVAYHWDDDEGFPRMVIDGYKNEERLKRKMRAYGCHFLKTDEVFDLPEQIHQTIRIGTTKDYRTFRKKSIVTIGETELVGDNTLTKMLYERQLCGQYNQDKIEAFRDLVESTNDRLIVFYNFWDELRLLMEEAKTQERQFSVICGLRKSLIEYERTDNSITFVQYQAGAMGLNLQKANKIIYFTPPLSSELFEQSKKRIHRIGQDRTCFYYYLTCKNSIEEKIYRTLEMRKDYTEALFEHDS